MAPVFSLPSAAPFAMWLCRSFHQGVESSRPPVECGLSRGWLWATECRGNEVISVLSLGIKRLWTLLFSLTGTHHHHVNLPGLAYWGTSTTWLSHPCHHHRWLSVDHQAREIILGLPAPSQLTLPACLSPAGQQLSQPTSAERSNWVIDSLPVINFFQTTKLWDSLLRNTT